MTWVKKEDHVSALVLENKLRQETQELKVAVDSFYERRVGVVGQSSRLYLFPEGPETNCQNNVPRKQVEVHLHLEGEWGFRGALRPAVKYQIGPFFSPNVV